MSVPTLSFNETPIDNLSDLQAGINAGGFAIPFYDANGELNYQPNGATFPALNDFTRGGGIKDMSAQILALLGDCWGILTTAPRPLKNGHGGYVFKTGVYPLGGSSLNVNDFILPPP